MDFIQSSLKYSLYTQKDSEDKKDWHYLKPWKGLFYASTQTCSISTAFMMIFFTVASDGLLIKCLNMRQAKSQWRPCEENENKT